MTFGLGRASMSLFVGRRRERIIPKQGLGLDWVGGLWGNVLPKDSLKGERVSGAVVVHALKPSTREAEARGSLSSRPG